MKKELLFGKQKQNNKKGCLKIDHKSFFKTTFLLHYIFCETTDAIMRELKH